MVIESTMLGSKSVNRNDKDSAIAMLSDIDAERSPPAAYSNAPILTGFSPDGLENGESRSDVTERRKSHAFRAFALSCFRGLFDALSDDTRVARIARQSARRSRKRKRPRRPCFSPARQSRSREGSGFRTWRQRFAAKS